MRKNRKVARILTIGLVWSMVWNSAGPSFAGTSGVDQHMETQADSDGNRWRDIATESNASNPKADEKHEEATPAHATPANAYVTYYVDASNGNDENEGISEEAPWKSLDKINQTTFEPGDQILLKSGGIWNGYLYPKGDGSEAAPITLGKYGGDAYPIINGNGSLPNGMSKADEEGQYNPVILLSNQSNWVIEGLEVTNSAQNSNNHVGILLYTTGVSGKTSNITVRDCYVHDVTATTGNQKLTGGILIIGSEKWIDGNMPKESCEKEIGFSDVLVENNHVKNVAQEGIRTSTKGDSFTKKNSDIVFRGNYIEEVFGDGIVLSQVVSGGVVENNVVKNHCNFSAANYAGAWLWYCEDAVFRYNEVFGGKYGYNDGEAFDYDLGCKNITYEYNYSHNNKGGFCLFMQGNPDATFTFRYNISANDGKESQELFHGSPNDTKIYNNTMYIGKGMTTSIFQNGKVNFFKNNMVLSHGNVPEFAHGGITAGDVTNNIFYPASMVAKNGLNEKTQAKNIFLEPKLSSPQSSTGYDEHTYDLTYENMGQDDEFIEWLRKRMEMFKLTGNSPAIDGGVVVDKRVTEDIFGNSIVGTPDIGAHEFTNDPGSVDQDKTRTEKLELDKTEVYLVLGDVMDLNASVTPIDALDLSVSWKAEDSEVAAVDTAGRITAKTAGKTVITAFSNDNVDVKADCIVHVFEKDVKEIHTDRDASIWDGGTYSGSDPLMRVKLDAAKSIRRVLVSFDLTDAPETYNQISLKLHIDKSGADQVPYDIYEITDNWEENKVTWKNQPVPVSDPILSFTSGISAGGNWLELDMTEYIEKQLVAGKERSSFVIVGEIAGSKNFIDIHSKESAFAPRLTFDNETIASVEEVLLSTAVGKTPKLPQTIEVIYKDGSKKEMTVAWDEITPDNYQQEGQFSVCGYIEGRQAPVVAYVKVSDRIIMGLTDVMVTTAAGVAPVLPKQVEAVLVTGETEMITVVWDTVAESRYQKIGEFYVKGRIADYSGICKLKVVVKEADIVAFDVLDIIGYVGFAPVLPKQVRATHTDGERRLVDVSWNEIRQEQYTAENKFNAVGFCDDTEQKAEARVSIVRASALPVWITNPVGKYPNLPQKVEIETTGRLKLKRGMKSMVPVVWEPVKPKCYNGIEPYNVKGTILNTTIPAEVTVQPSEAVSLEPREVLAVGDTYIQVTPSSKKFGAENQICIKNHTEDMAYKRDGLVKFDLTAHNQEQVTGMILRLYLNSMDQVNNKPKVSINIYTTAAGWGEDAATYDSITQAPGYKTKRICEKVPVTWTMIGSYVEIDVSKALSELSGSNLAFAITMDENPSANPNGDKSGIKFSSKEGLNAPRLQLTYDYITEIEKVEATVEMGETPDLPNTICVTDTSGSKRLAAVKWNEISETLLQTEGQFLACGTSDEVYCNVTATVTVTKKENEGSGEGEKPGEDEKPQGTLPAPPSSDDDNGTYGDAEPEASPGVWQLIGDEEWQFVGYDGKAMSGWIRYKNHWYFTNENGIMQTGWRLSNHIWYYMGENGEMYADGMTPDGYRVDTTGAWIY